MLELAASPPSCGVNPSYHAIPVFPQIAQHPTLPPMLRQYCEYKAQYPDSLILFQVGDFYEVFYDDAVTVARSLNLTLTSRDKNSDEPVPMCGVPIGVVDGYLDRLVDLGFSVALVSQSVPASEVAKGMVPRALERIVTPGIRILGGSTDSPGAAVGVAAVLLVSEGVFALAWTDVQSGVVWIRDGVAGAELLGELARIAPGEAILCDRLGESAVDRRLGWVRALERRFPQRLKWRGPSFLEGEQFDSVQGLSSLSPAARKASRLLLNYLEESMIPVRGAITRVEPRHYDDTMSIDATTRANLELVSSLRDGSTRGTLYGYLNLTVTHRGPQILRQWIQQPLTNPERIKERHDAVQAFLADATMLDRIRTVLGRASDAERIATRIGLGVANPREIAALRDLLVVLPVIKRELASASDSAILIRRLIEAMVLADDCLVGMQAFLADEPPATLSEGGIVRQGFHSELDELRALRDTGRGWVTEYELRERQRSGIQSLKVKFNSVIGYFIEVPTARGDVVPAEYIRRQSTANTERFVVPELKEMEVKILGANDRVIRLEHELFQKFRATLVPYISDFRRIGNAISMLDVLASFASVAKRENLVRPIVSGRPSLEIEKGKHPVIAASLQTRFVPNSLVLNGDAVRCGVITGPNMGGKSTFLRQSALIVVMAQIGSFVSALAAHVGIVDKLFARIGSSDDIHEGESTFMVEMREAASIVHGATNSSLVLIDEIGRGTSTVDGEALAQAILEWMVNETKCRMLFATHYHELTGLASNNPNIYNLSVAAVQRGDAVFFTHEIVRGAANRSYGLQVAQRAGLPVELLSRAQEILNEHTIRRGSRTPRTPSAAPTVESPQLPLFEVPTAPPPERRALQQLRDFISAENPDEMTPRQAHGRWYELVALAKGL